MTAKSIKAALREWMLPISMTIGAAMYFIFAALPISDAGRGSVDDFVSVIQPLMLFTMLFLTFCKVAPHDLKLHRWHFMILGIQMGLFVLFSLAAIWVGEAVAGDEFFGRADLRASLECAMLCFACPTATAAAVVTSKLEGSTASIVSYTMVCNLAVALLAPLMLPLVHPQEGVDFINAFFMIMGKVFPLLICPLILAWFIRYLFPVLHKKILSYPDLAFYIWAVSLALAIAVTFKCIVQSGAGFGCLLGMAIASLISCCMQFWIGKVIGTPYGDRIASGQAMGQKNTVFAIWMGYTFLSPVSSVAGGFYSLWHNIFNSWQLHKAGKK